MTETIGQAQVVEASIVGTIGQADGSTESPNADRIREAAYRGGSWCATSQSARWLEGIVLLTNERIETLSDKDLEREVAQAIVVMRAISTDECEEIARRAGL